MTTATLLFAFCMICASVFMCLHTYWIGEEFGLFLPPYFDAQRYHERLHKLSPIKQTIIGIGIPLQIIMLVIAAAALLVDFLSVLK
jgi:membrane protein YqaA with SNARE-associated domain